LTPTSELSQVNAAGGRRCETSVCALDALRLAIDGTKLTGGAADPTDRQTMLEIGQDRDWARQSMCRRTSRCTTV
jgi:thiamine biosynthesis lipoprotein ApbE